MVPEAAIAVEIPGSPDESTGVDWLAPNLGEGERIALAEPIGALLARPAVRLIPSRLAPSNGSARRHGGMKPILTALRELSLGGGTGEGGRRRLGLVDVASLAALERIGRAAMIAWRGGTRRWRRMPSAVPTASGQDKPVFVHRLVAARRIEEKREALNGTQGCGGRALCDPAGAPTPADLDVLLEG
ncbi:hypothetical protein [Methylobacterium terricola]|uniref:hypothetical protein n=1 Tax=Methylobacterium terricola TaxID=2583531 RepID=UPI001486F8D6|nr:hypothetical protein [Methylobacterium terricola]